MGSDERRLGALLVAGGCLPFAAGALAGRDGDTGLLPPCPFREATGSPLPAVRRHARVRAGGARRRRLALLQRALGRAGGAAVAAGALAAGGRATADPGAAPLAVAAVLFAAVAWAYALAQRQTIMAGTPSIGLLVVSELPTAMPITIRITNSAQMLDADPAEHDPGDRVAAAADPPAGRVDLVARLVAEHEREHGADQRAQDEPEDPQHQRGGRLAARDRAALGPAPVGRLIPAGGTGLLRGAAERAPGASRPRCRAAATATASRPAATGSASHPPGVPLLTRVARYPHLRRKLATILSTGPV